MTDHPTDPYGSLDALRDEDLAWAVATDPEQWGERLWHRLEAEQARRERRKRA